MKLRNKKTGQIYNACHIAFGESLDGLEKTQWKTLKEFNEDWEDVPEEKKGIIEVKQGLVPTCVHIVMATEEEAEKAVEKLKAWKRLKDKGFKFIGIDGLSDRVYFEVDSKYLNGHVMYDEYSNTDDKLREYNKDLELLFGGEE